MFFEKLKNNFINIKNIFNFLLTHYKYNCILTLTLEIRTEEIKINYILKEK